MDGKGYVGVGLLVAAGAYTVLLYNSLVQLKHNAAKAWANIDVLLKQRHDELPKLVETCRQYMRYEQPTIERVVAARGQLAEAREQRSPVAVGAAEGVLRQGLSRLYAVAEGYPELQADESFRFLQARISGLENAIADRREFYNDAANALNVRCEQFPDRIVASVFGVRAAQLLHFSAAETQDVDMKVLFD